ncbi:MAG: phenylalanine--tRNA ligase subunit beta [Candidatus Nezhaarchaeota archaeon]|nr:phenylalanine--tRNA ligase subunit beta [Candidatus Nezhaarchaeota archaeon]
MEGGVMPTVTIDSRELLAMLRGSVSLNELMDILFFHKCLVESVNGWNITIEVTADRPDMLSIEGIARALKLFLGLEEPRKYEVLDGNVTISVDPLVFNSRPFILSAIIRGVSLSEGLIQQLMVFQEKLHLTYCRRRSKAAIGLHDLDTVGHRIIYTALPPSDIRFIPLGEEREMSGDEILMYTEKGREFSFLFKGFDRYPLLLDERGRALSMPPIINCSSTKVTPLTKNLFIEVTGTDFGTVSQALNVVALNVLERGGVLEKVKVLYPDRHISSPILDTQVQYVELSYINNCLGLSLTEEEVVSCLKRMGHIATAHRGTVEVHPPPYRCDILHAIDIVEDVAIGYGFNRIIPERPPRTQVGSLLNITKLTNVARELMVGLGFQEILNYTLTAIEVISLNASLSIEDVVVLENPISSEYACLRNWLIPILLNFLSRNKHARLPQKVFECGDVVYADPSSPTSTRVERKLAAAICSNKVGYEDVQSCLYALLRNLGFSEWFIEPISHPCFIEGRSARIKVNEDEVAILGETHPEVLVLFGLESPVACFELNLSKVLSLLTPQRCYE